MEITIEEALKRGIEAHKAGKIHEADRYYTAILKIQFQHPDANHNLGVLAVSIGRVEQALPFLKTALEANPNISQFWLSYIDALIKLGRMKDAQNALFQALARGAKGDAFDQLKKQLNDTILEEANEVTQETLKSLMDLYNQGLLQEVLKRTTDLLQQFPRSINLYNILGATHSGLTQFDSAIDSYKKALKINHNYAEAYNNMGVAQKNKGNIEAAIDSYKKALKIKPDYAEAYNNLGSAFKDKGEFVEAINSCKKALKIRPEFVEAYYNIGLAIQAQGDLKAAIESYKQALKIKPDYADAYNDMGNALQGQGNLNTAIDCYKEALKIRPEFVEVYYNMGNALKEKGDPDSAIASYMKALKIKPDYAEVYNNIGNSQEDIGNIVAAINSYKKALKIMPTLTVAHRNLSNLYTYLEPDKHFIQMKKLYQDPNLSDEQLCHLCFGLAKASEDLKDFKLSYSYLNEGNALRKKMLGYNITQDIEVFESIKSVHKKISAITLDMSQQKLEANPIFILGMPRSGTTLIEQIISSHHKVTGAGELDFIGLLGTSLVVGKSEANEEALRTFRNNYLTELDVKSEGKPFVTDKMPHNFLFIGLISKAFPNAKIIHVKRDAAATCWSNYKHYFVTNGLGYCYDIKDIVRYYGLYTDIMAFWQEHCGDRIYELDYELLVQKQKIETRKLIDHLGIGWNDACLEPHNNKRVIRTSSHQQVRKKIYKGSSKSWKEFKPFLDGAFDLFERLQKV